MRRYQIPVTEVEQKAVAAGNYNLAPIRPLSRWRVLFGRSIGSAAPSNATTGRYATSGDPLPTAGVVHQLPFLSATMAAQRRPLVYKQ